jgi:hypothetical protein
MRLLGFKSSYESKATLSPIYEGRAVVQLRFQSQMQIPNSMLNDDPYVNPNI